MKIIIIGDNEFAEIASLYFQKDYGYETVAFAVEKEFIRHDELLGKPIVPLERLTSIYKPEEYGFFACPVYTKLNRLRQRFYKQCKSWGYKPLKYISPHAFVWENVEIGENCFVFEDNTIQYNAKIGDNVILWSGNHIGHSAKISDNVFISSHVVVSGYVEIGSNCFLGVNSSLGNNISIARDCIIGAGAVVTKNCEEIGSIYVGNPARKSEKTAYHYFGIDEKE